MDPAAMVTKSKVFSVCPDKETAYKALQRNQYYCPALKSSIMTLKFIRGVIFKTEYWLQKVSEIQIFISPDPPSN